MALFHFDLRHTRDAHELRVEVYGSHYELSAHAAEGPTGALAENRAMALLSDEARLGFTHYAEVGDHHFEEEEEIRWIRVVRPTPPECHLDQCVLMSLHLPEETLRTYYRRRFEHYARFSEEELRNHHRRSLRHKPRVHSGKLAALGVEAVPEDHDEAIEVLLHARHMIGVDDTAAGFVVHHPSLANVQPATQAVVMEDHVFPDPAVDPDQFNAIQALSASMKQNDPWSFVVECRDKDDKPIKAGYDLKDKDTGKGFSEGQQLYSWDVAEPVLGVAAAPIAGACRTASDDLSLSTQVWTPTPGTSVLVKDVGAASAAAEAEEAPSDEPSYKWTVDDLTVNHGVQLKPGSITLDSSDNFSIDAQNWYLRSLYVGYELLDENKNPVGSTELLYQIGAVDSIAGIPIPIDPTALKVNLKGHSGVRFKFGSLGTSDWDPDVSWRGALLTGFWQYGVPIFFTVAGQKLTASKTFVRLMNDKDLVAALMGIGFSIAGAGLATATAVTKSWHYLVMLANKVASMALQKGMEKFGEWLAEQVTASLITTAFGPAGLVFKAAAAVMNVEGMVITTIETATSPATIRMTCSRAIDVGVTLHPDPRHGEKGRPETAIWPSLADRYVATLVYRDGTNRVVKGELPKATAGTAVTIKFADVPADGQFRVLFGVYSSTGWLAGSWQSDWTAAKPNKGTTLDLGSQTITESLVPLAGDTQYVFKERIAYTGGAFVWQAGGPPPATTRAGLDCGPSGTLCEIVDATLNNSAFQLGYAWRASGQNLPPDSKSVPPSNAQLYALQSLSVLADPGKRLIKSDVGLTNRPAIAYAPSTNPANEIDETNFVVDPRGGGMNLRQVKLDGGQASFGLGAGDLKSWGRFPLENVDAAAVHPSNAVIACSWKHRKLMILPLPAAPLPDDQAPSALVVSGEGLREGLMQGPAALAVAPDGRILVLETLNRRVQAFDTSGNPVPSFTPGNVSFTLDTAQVAAALDKGEVPESLQAGLQAKGIGLVCSLDSSFAAQLDSARFQAEKDPLIEALAQHQVVLSFDPAAIDDPKLSARIEVVKQGSSWTITDPRGMSWQVLADEDGLSVYTRLSRPTVRVERAGQQWLVIDGVHGLALKLTPATGAKTGVRLCQSWFPLRGLGNRQLTYLDLAVEAQGYVYVLSHQADGAEPSDYLLDVYAPDGSWLFRTPDPSLSKTPQNVVAGKLAVDIWRNMYAVTYETLHGPNGDPQPGIAHWTPTPPLFTLPLTSEAAFDPPNIAAVQADFAAHQIKLSNQAFVTVLTPKGAWQVKDGAAVWDVYRSGDGLQVYALSA
ncbi:MAG: hypothetical protein M3340_02080 [Actinomycetota bacterium]|nr:hypothetical protein [Actinomycetota bacterium]